MTADATNLAAVPTGRWLVGVSGGADSVALLRLLADHQRDVEPIVVHVHHNLRGRDADDDAAFVESLAARLVLPFVRHTLATPPEANVEARLRAARYACFAETARDRGALGVVVAHHADDRAETILLRLLRGGEAIALDPLRGSTTLGGLRVERPLLGVRSGELRAYLRSIDQPWREDASNVDPRFARNGARSLLRERPELFDAVSRVGRASRAWRRATLAAAPELGERFAAARLAAAPPAAARAAIRRWLRGRGVTGATPANVAAVVEMARDAATPPRVTVAGGVAIRRRAGGIGVER